METSSHPSHTALYLVVFAILMALLAATVAVAFYDTGRAALTITLLIAFAKAVLVILFFMHVAFGQKLTWIVAAGGFVWLGILLTFTFSDYLTRGWLAPPARVQGFERSPQPGTAVGASKAVRESRRLGSAR